MSFQEVTIICKVSIPIWVQFLTDVGKITDTKQQKYYLIREMLDI